MKFAATFWQKQWYQFDPADSGAPLLAKVNQMDRFGMLLVCLDTITFVSFRRKKGAVIAEQPVVGKIGGGVNLASVIGNTLAEASDEALPVFVLTNDSHQSGKPQVEHSETKYDGGLDDYHHYRASVKENREVVTVQTPVPLTHMSIKEEFNLESDLMQAVQKFFAAKEIPLIGVFSPTQFVMASVVANMPNAKVFTDAGVLAVHLTSVDKIVFSFKSRDIKDVALCGGEDEVDSFCRSADGRLDVVFPGACQDVHDLKEVITLEQILATGPLIVGKDKVTLNPAKPYFHKDMGPSGGDFVQPVPAAMKPIAFLFAALVIGLIGLNIVNLVNTSSAKEQAKASARALAGSKKTRADAENEFQTVQKGYYSYIWARNLTRYNAQTAQIAQAIFGNIAKTQPIEHAQIVWSQEKEAITAEFELNFLPSGEQAQITLQNQIKAQLRNIPVIEGLVRSQDPTTIGTPTGIKFGVEFVPSTIVTK
jgi:hypothetical protein